MKKEQNKSPLDNSPAFDEILEHMEKRANFRLFLIGCVMSAFAVGFAAFLTGEIVMWYGSGELPIGPSILVDTENLDYHK